MMQTASSLYSLKYDDERTYGLTLLFIIGNIVLPQFCHMFPLGGITWLPIYFFTLIASYKYGWRVGVLTAIFSPLVNSLLFSMPAATALPSIMLKSILLAVFAAFIAVKYKKATLWPLMVVVISYQITGSFGEWIIKGDIYLALQDFRIGVPGMLLQIFGGWIVINKILRK